MMNALRIKQPEAGLNRSRMSAISVCVCTHARLLPFSWSGPVSRGVKACVRTGQPTQPSPSFFKLRRQHASISSKSWSQSQYCDTALRTAPPGHAGESGRYRRPRGLSFPCRDPSQAGRCVWGACQRPSLWGWWISNLATFFICKDSRERTGARSRSVRVQSSNTLAASVAATGRAAEGERPVGLNLSALL
jgi:hypothetical protein